MGAAFDDAAVFEILKTNGAFATHLTVKEKQDVGDVGGDEGLVGCGRNRTVVRLVVPRKAVFSCQRYPDPMKKSPIVSSLKFPV